MSYKIKNKLNKILNRKYSYGFVTDIKSKVLRAGIDKETVKTISKLKKEPKFMLELRLQAYNHWVTLKEPTWGNIHYPKIDYQSIHYYSTPQYNKSQRKEQGLKDIDPKILETYQKLGIPLVEQEILSGVAVDAVFDSISVATTYKEQLAAFGIIFCPFSEAVREYPELIKKYFSSVVSYKDNYFAALNSAVFSEGTFIYIPKGVQCPVELSTYFRLNTAKLGQFERTLIIADENSYVSYIEGCTAPMRDLNQLHAAVVELVTLDSATIKYSTVQNWYPGNDQGIGGIYNFVTKRGLCSGDNSKIIWTQVEVGSAITWKYPSVILQGNNSTGEFYSIALTNHYQQADTGTKMIHIGENSKSKIISKGISAGCSLNTYRGLLQVGKKAQHARNYSRCDTLLLSKHTQSYTYPTIQVQNSNAQVEHEATVSKLSEEQLFYCRQRGLNLDEAASLIIGGFCQEVVEELPMEFAVEVNRLFEICLEDCFKE